MTKSNPTPAEIEAEQREGELRDLDNLRLDAERLVDEPKGADDYDVQMKAEEINAAALAVVGRYWNVLEDRPAHVLMDVEEKAKANSARLRIPLAQARRRIQKMLMDAALDEDLQIPGGRVALDLAPEVPGYPDTWRSPKAHVHVLFTSLTFDSPFYVEGEAEVMVHVFRPDYDKAGWEQVNRFTGESQQRAGDRHLGGWGDIVAVEPIDGIEERIAELRQAVVDYTRTNPAYDPNRYRREPEPDEVTGRIGRSRRGERVDEKPF